MIHNLLLLPKATKKPSGIEKSKVKKNISRVVPVASSIFGIK
jgi:hypothetical protein